MAGRDYWRGRDDFEYQGYPSPPRCNYDDLECRRAERDYEDGYRAAEREREEERAAQRAAERRRQEDEFWLEQQRIAEEQRRAMEEQYPEPSVEDYCEWEGHVPCRPTAGLVALCYCGQRPSYNRFTPR